MKYQKHIAILLLLLFAAAVVMAAEVNRGAFTVSVSSSAKCGDIEVTLYTYEGTNPTKHTFTNHDYSKVTNVTPSHGCNYLVDAEYSIVYSVTAEGDTDIKVHVKITGDSIVLNSNGCQVGGKAVGISSSKDFNGWGIWDGPLHFQRKFKISKAQTYDWTTDTPGDYKAQASGEGNVQIVDGGGGGVTTGLGALGFSRTLGGSWGPKHRRTGHPYYTTAVVNGNSEKSFTFIDEADFTVGSQPMDLTRLYTSSP